MNAIDYKISEIRSLCQVLEDSDSPLFIDLLMYEHEVIFELNKKYSRRNLGLYSFLKTEEDLAKAIEFIKQHIY